MSPGLAIDTIIIITEELPSYYSRVALVHWWYPIASSTSTSQASFKFFKIPPMK